MEDDHSRDRMARKPQKRFSLNLRKKGGLPWPDGEAVAQNLGSGKRLEDFTHQVQCSYRAPSGDDHHIRFPQPPFNLLLEIVKVVLCNP